MAVLPFVNNAAAALAIVAMLGFTDCLIQGSIFALAGMFSPKYVAATMSGACFPSCLLTIE